MNSLIKVNNLTYRQPLPVGDPITILDDINLQVEAGEWVAIVGANGSGKTSLVRHFNTLLKPQIGTVFIEGLDTHDKANRMAIRQTVGMVFQNPTDQFVATIVEEDVAFGLENMGRPPIGIREQVKISLEAVRMWPFRQRPPHMLSAGQMQRVALAGVLAMRPRCIIFDETTAMLDPSGRQEVLQTLKKLHQDGITIVSITHFMEEAALADRIIVMHQGRIEADCAPKPLFSNPAALTDWKLAPPAAVEISSILTPYMEMAQPNALTLEALLMSLPDPPKSMRVLSNSAAFSEVPKPDNSAIIDIQDLNYTYMKGMPLAHIALSDISLTVPENGGFALLGATGSGKSTLLQHMNGLFKPQSGVVRVGHYDLSDPEITVQTICSLAGLVFQNPENHFFEQFVGDEISFGPRQQGLSKPEIVERVKQAMFLVGLDFDTYKDRFTFTLSGGEQRKTAIASILALAPQILLLDEPTAGMDPISRRELTGHLSELRNRGRTLVLSSHQMDDVSQLTGQAALLNDGRILTSASTPQVFSNQAVLTSAGLEAPAAAQVAQQLIQSGWPLPPGITLPDQLKATLAQLHEKGEV
jgi:energy-coupling factor transport system ATP-binding protein